jgi:hypothetical protein
MAYLFKLMVASSIGLVLLTSSAVLCRAQAPLRIGATQLQQLLERLETHTDRFKQSFATALKRSVLQGGEQGEYLQRFQQQFEEQTDRLKQRSRDRAPVAADVQEVLNRAAYLDTAMRSYDFGFEAERDWQFLRADLNQLAQAFRIQTRWDVPVTLGGPLTVDLEALANRLTGTYTLDEGQSADERASIEQLTNQLPAGERRRVLTTLLSRLRAPQQLALQRRGNQITLATSLQPAQVYTADGQPHRQPARRGEQVKAFLYGDQFRLETSDAQDNLYVVSLDVTEQGARLHVARTALLPQFTRPLVLISRYKKIADEPRLNLAEEAQVSPTNRNGVPRR